MKREHIVRLMAGTFVLIGLAIYQWVHPAGLFICLFVGLNLFQSALTKWCPAEIILRKLGIGKA